MFEALARDFRGFCATEVGHQAAEATDGAVRQLNRPARRVWLVSEKGRRDASFSEKGMGQSMLSFSQNTQTHFETLTGGQKMNIKSL
ncbi:hypothetical protein, partial [Aquibium sp. ELW1220]|uniref:hypothetical protein n=1 Tax=Aquibium sp. ELW1220 TaxID=2976766 RepID=UPI0025B05E8A